MLHTDDVKQRVSKNLLDLNLSSSSTIAARPAIAAPVPNVADANTIYLGYPIWWGTAPRIILTFLDTADTAGKTIIPFCTSGSSSISGSIAELHAAAPEANWKEGRRFSASASQQEVDAWVASE